jgi:hypothetical protein
MFEAPVVQQFVAAGRRPGSGSANPGGRPSSPSLDQRRVFAGFRGP